MGDMTRDTGGGLQCRTILSACRDTKAMWLRGTGLLIQEVLSPLIPSLKL